MTEEFRLKDIPEEFQTPAAKLHLITSELNNHTTLLNNVNSGKESIPSDQYIRIVDRYNELRAEHDLEFDKILDDIDECMKNNTTIDMNLYRFKQYLLRVR